jgi:hypothetical protein
MARKKSKSSVSGLASLDKESYVINKRNSRRTTISDDGELAFDAEPDEQVGSDEEQDHYRNLVDDLEDDQLYELGFRTSDAFESDERSRSDWMRTTELGLNLTGVKLEERSTPFEGACSAQHPLLMEAAVKFQSKASNELLPANGPVKTFVKGDATIEKEEQANRVKAHMNYQILEEMTEFYPDAERMLLYVALVGSGFKKTYYNKELKRPCSEFIPADQFVVPNSAPDLFRADRYTHVLYKTEYEIEECFASGFYKKPERGWGIAQSPRETPVQKKTQELMGTKTGLNERDKVYTLLEQHVMLHIEGLDEREGKEEYALASPYIVTVDNATKSVIGLRRNWKPNDPARQKRLPFSHYQLVPSFGFYGFGFLHLLGNLQLTLTSAMRSLVDAGQFANLQGGFKLKGTRIVDDGSPISPGQFKELEAMVQDVNKAIMPLPFKEPSNVLFEMLQFIQAAGQKFADSTESVIADSVNYGPVGTTMALLDASTKFFSAIHKRLHAALKHELRQIAEINSETLGDDIEYNIQGESMNISRADYGPIVAIIPVSDPNISSNAHRMTKAQTIMQAAQQAPQLHDMREIYRQFYVAMDFENVDKIMPPPQQAQPQDPMSDILMAQQGKPIQAFPGQDHKSHIALKQAFLQDPSSGASPMMQKVAMQVQANVQEHMVLQFKEQVMAQLQLSGQQQQPQQGQQQQSGPTDPQAAQAQQDQAMAQAAQQVAQLNQKNLQQQVAQQSSVSPARDQAALVTAQARADEVKIRAHKAIKEDHYKDSELKLKAGKLALDHLRITKDEHNKDKDRSSKLDQIVATKGLDALIQQNSQHIQGRQNQSDNMQKAQLERANNEHQAVLDRQNAAHQASLEPPPEPPSQTD